jgi:hypothetical protein
MILTNERVDAATALRIGLVQEVVEKGKALEVATAMAERVATLSPRAVEYCKSLIHNARNGIPRRAGLALERERFMDLFDHGDHRVIRHPTLTRAVVVQNVTETQPALLHSISPELCPLRGAGKDCLDAGWTSLAEPLSQAQD